VERGLVSASDYEALESITRQLFQRGSEQAAEKGLILVDTKYEFGRAPDGRIMLIDEIHTPDSSRYFYAEGYQERQQKGMPQKQLSKEFVRQWLISHGFQGLEGQSLPEMTDAYVTSVSERYVELYENILGTPFEKGDISDIKNRIQQNVTRYLQTRP
jgi:phosphoribosylaminoimidazole-succinocarboxamide synthase